MAGDGNYGGNGSVYWRNHSGAASSVGRDPVPIADIGGFTGNFQLKLRYTTTLTGKTPDDLEQLLQEVIDAAIQAKDRIHRGSTDETIAVQVPAIRRTSPPPPSANWEVHLDW